MLEVKPPTAIPSTKDPIIFLGGSINMGKASPWRETVIKALAHTNAVFLNPWGDYFDPETPQDADNPKFSGQVNWELDGLEAADIVLFYFDADGQSPITLLELGMNVKTSKAVIVRCPEGFWRKGNVDVVCRRYGVPQVDDIEDLIDVTKQWIYLINSKLL